MNVQKTVVFSKSELLIMKSCIEEWAEMVKHNKNADDNKKLAVLLKKLKIADELSVELTDGELFILSDKVAGRKDTILIELRQGKESPHGDLTSVQEIKTLLEKLK